MLVFKYNLYSNVYKSKIDWYIDHGMVIILLNRKEWK